MCNVDQLFNRVAEQNFVPVVDDRGVFIGIVTRKAVIKFLTDIYETTKNG
jgi:predicted transcriptional regulator